jgi:hypothetical protein
MGRVANMKGRWTFGIDRDGYKSTSIYLNDKTRKKVQVHRLIILGFYGSDERLVNHKDGNKKNNKLTNLEYVTASENTIHAISTGLKTFSGNNGYRRPVYQILNGMILNAFPSIADASRQTGINDVGICEVCNNNQSHAGGYYWRYVSLNQ